MGRLDSSSEKNSLCRTVLPIVWRLAGRVELNQKKAFQIWVWDSLPSPRDAPTAATPMIGNLRAARCRPQRFPREEDFAQVLSLSTDHLTRS